MYNSNGEKVSTGLSVSICLCSVKGWTVGPQKVTSIPELRDMSGWGKGKPLLRCTEEWPAGFWAASPSESVMGDAPLE